MVKQSFFNNKVLLISVLGLLFVHALAFQGWAAELKNYSLALENEFLRLYVRAETASLRWRISPAARFGTAQQKTLT